MGREIRPFFCSPRGSSGPGGRRRCGQARCSSQNHRLLPASVHQSDIFTGNTQITIATRHRQHHRRNRGDIPAAVLVMGSSGATRRRRCSNYSCAVPDRRPAMCSVRQRVQCVAAWQRYHEDHSGTEPNGAMDVHEFRHASPAILDIHHPITRAPLALSVAPARPLTSSSDSGQAIMSISASCGSVGTLSRSWQSNANAAARRAAASVAVSHSRGSELPHQLGQRPRHGFEHSIRGR